MSSSKIDAHAPLPPRVNGFVLGSPGSGISMRPCADAHALSCLSSDCPSTTDSERAAAMIREILKEAVR
jgi:hypothetical protein